MNKQVEVPIDDAILAEWRRKFQELEDRERAKGIELVFVLIDGFLLYYDPVSAGKGACRMTLSEALSLFRTVHNTMMPYSSSASLTRL